MVDKMNPTSQFHPYQPQDAVPQSELAPQGGLGGILSRLGIDQSKINATGGQLGSQLQKVRGMAQKNPSLVLGGLAALAIGAGLLRRRG